jgi:glycosyltransferase involved in cell wall biosynthesis
VSNLFTIFFDCHSFDTGWQGTTTYLAGVLNALPAAAARGAPHINLRIVCAARDEAAIRRHVGVNFDFLRINTGFGRRNLLDIPAALMRTRADLVVSQYVRPFFSPCPTLSVIHDVLFLDYPGSYSKSYRKVRRSLFSWSARRSHFVSTVSTYSAKRISAHFKIDPSRILITPNAVDPAFLSEERKTRPTTAGGPIRLLMVSRFEQRKRVEWGIEAMDALAEAGVSCELTIVGSGEGRYAESIRRLVDVAKTRRGHSISVKAGLSIADLVSEYGRSDLFLFPAEAEGFGIPVIEAAAVGTPCVISDGGALAGFNGHFCGATFPSHDKEAFLSSVKSVVHRLPELKIQAAENRHRVSKTYSWSVAAQPYVDVIRQLRGSN